MQVHFPFLQHKDSLLQEEVVEQLFAWCDSGVVVDTGVPAADSRQENTLYPQHNLLCAKHNPGAYISGTLLVRV